MTTTNHTDAIIVGGGLAGLTAAAYLARSGRSATVFERADRVGGRAQTTDAGGFKLNFGPHALYKTHAAGQVLADLGIRVAGGTPSGKRSYAVYRGVLHTLPIGFLSMLTTGLLGLGEKLTVARVLGGLSRMDVEPWRGVPLRAWVESVSDSAVVRDLIYANTRVATYANMPDELDAAAAIEQVRGAYTGGVQYLDGGWQTMVDALRDAAVSAGARVVTGAAVESLSGTTVTLADGSEHTADAIVIAASPRVVTDLTGHAWRLTPVRAACLDIALHTVPNPRSVFALGIDEPTYYSLHSAYADLAPDDAGAVIHVAKYLAPDDDGHAAREGLEALVDTLQPGWRDCTAEVRYLPRITVSHAAWSPAGRPGVALSDRIYIAGDWVGDEGMLADAACASGRLAARSIIESASNHTADGIERTAA